MTLQRISPVSMCRALPLGCADCWQTARRV